MTGNDWRDEHAADYASYAPAPGNEPGTAEQPDTVMFGTEGGTRARRHTRRTIFAVVSSVAAVALVAVVALVTTGSGQTPAQAVTSAVSQSGGYNTVSARISENVTGLTSVTLTGKVTARRSPLLLSMKVSEDVAGQNVPISAIITGNAMYLKLGVSQGIAARERGKWIELRFAQLGSLSSLASLLHSLQSENPVSQVKELFAAKHVHAAGTQVVRGMQTTKYAGSFSPSAAIKVLPKALRSELSPTLKQITGNVAFGIWVNAGRIWKLTEVEHIMSSTVKVTIQYLSYNQPVHITIPSRSQVFIPPASALGGS